MDLVPSWPFKYPAPTRAATVVNFLRPVPPAWQVADASLLDVTEYLPVP